MLRFYRVKDIHFTFTEETNDRMLVWSQAQNVVKGKANPATFVAIVHLWHSDAADAARLEGALCGVFSQKQLLRKIC